MELIKILLAKRKFIKEKLEHYHQYNQDYSLRYAKRMAQKAWKNKITNLKRLHQTDYLNHIMQNKFF